MAELKIRKLNEDEHGLWDNFVNESEQVNLFSTSAWLKVLNTTHDGRAEILAVFGGEAILAGVLVFERKSGIFKAAAYPPLTPFTSIIFKKPSSRRISKIESEQKEIISLLSAYLMKSYNYVSLLLHPSIKDIRDFKWLNWKHNTNYTYEVDLQNINSLWENLDKDCRYEINKAKKNGIVVTNSTDVKMFYGLYKETFLKQNKNPPIKEEFIEKMFSILKDNKMAEMFIAETAGKKAAAASIVVWDSKNAYYLLAASEPDIKQGAPSMLLWRIIELMSKRFKSMDMVGANTQSIVKFKRDFATELVPYFCVEKSNIAINILLKLKGIFRF